MDNYLSFAHLFADMMKQREFVREAKSSFATEMPLIHGGVMLPEFQGEKSRSHLCCISHPAEENEFD